MVPGKVKQDLAPRSRQQQCCCRSHRPCPAQPNLVTGHQSGHPSSTTSWAVECLYCIAIHHDWQQALTDSKHRISGKHHSTQLHSCDGAAHSPAPTFHCRPSIC